MIRVSQLKLPVEHSEEQFYQKIEKSLKIKKDQIKKLQIVKKSIDARKSPIYIYAVQLELNKYNLKKLPKDVSIVKKEEKQRYKKNESDLCCV